MTGLLASLLWTSPAVADGGACPAGEACLLVTFVGTVSGSVIVTGAQLDEWHDMKDPPYRTHDPNSVADNPRPATATSIAAILRNETAFPTVPIESVTFVSARQQDGSYATRLSPVDLGAPYTGNTGFQDDVVPGFSADLDHKNVRFTRPMRSDDDINYRDVWLSQTEGQATLVVHTTGRIVSPEIESVAKADAGAPVDFAVSYDGAAPRDPTYSWTFGDGTTATGPTPQHTWGASGTFAVTLDVTGSDTSEGTATPVRVQVGPKPPASDVTQPGTGTGGPANTVTGPVKGKGKTPGSTTATIGQGTASTGTGAGAGTSGPGSALATQQMPGKKKAPVAVQVGTPVSGTLLVADALAVAPAPSSARPADAARAVPDPIRDWRWLWFLVLPGLLLVGAAGQSRWLHRRLPSVPWRVV